MSTHWIRFCICSSYSGRSLLRPWWALQGHLLSDWINERLTWTNLHSHSSIRCKERAGWEGIHSLIPSRAVGQLEGPCPELVWFIKVSGIPGWDSLFAGILLLICSLCGPLVCTFPILSLWGTAPFSFQSFCILPDTFLFLTGRQMWEKPSLLFLKAPRDPQCWCRWWHWHHPSMCMNSGQTEWKSPCGNHIVYGFCFEFVSYPRKHLRLWSFMSWVSPDQQQKQETHNLLFCGHV